MRHAAARDLAQMANVERALDAGAAERSASPRHVNGPPALKCNMRTSRSCGDERLCRAPVDVLGLVAPGPEGVHAMAAMPRVTLFHAPNSRSTGALTLMEELDVPYDLHVLEPRQERAARPEVPRGESDGQGARGATRRRAHHRAAGGVPVPRGPVSGGEPRAAASAIRCAGRICAGWCSTARPSSRPWWIAR